MCRPIEGGSLRRQTGTASVGKRGEKERAGGFVFRTSATIGLHSLNVARKDRVMPA